MSQEKIETLLIASMNDTATPEQLEELASLINASNSESLSPILKNAWESFNSEASMKEEKAEAILQYILSNQQKQHTPKIVPIYKRIWVQFAVAAMLLLMVGAGYYFFLNKPASTVEANKTPQDILPGSNKATLTLSDGKQVALDDVAKGKVADEDGALIDKSGNGELVYLPKAKTEKVTYNTLTTPNGGQHHLTLADGTQVWLNAGSSITFPTAFVEKERVVSITGEAYFEVTKNPQQPFKVKVRQQEVQVLGTHFNINAYTNEQQLKTTLLEGAVRVNVNKMMVMLKPGQQSQLTETGSIKVENSIDIEEVMAWKNGLFKLKSADIPSVLRQIARWYDVEIVYEGEMPKGHISGTVPRTMTLSKVLDALQLSGVKLEVDGRRVIVKQ